MNGFISNPKREFSIKCVSTAMMHISATRLVSICPEYVGVYENETLHISDLTED